MTTYIWQEMKFVALKLSGSSTGPVTSLLKIPVQNIEFELFLKTILSNQIKVFLPAMHVKSFNTPTR